MDSHGPGSLDEEVAALSRGMDRDSLFLQASLVLPGRTDAVVVRVRNLSAGGMLAENNAAVAEGDIVEVTLRNIGPVTGSIVWAGTGKFGIAFDRPINPQAVRRQVVSDNELPANLSGLGMGRPVKHRR